MSNFIIENFAELEKRHYIRKAGAQDYWLDFRATRIDNYHSLYGDCFCLIVYGSQEQDDAYIIPYAEIKPLLDPGYADSRGRWMGSISDDVLSIRRCDRSLIVASFYNAFEFLRDEDDEQFSDPMPAGRFEVSHETIRARIASFNRMYRDSVPKKCRAISEYIARPGSISEHIKKLRGFTCQLCGQLGFLKKNGVPFAETHHIVELHKLLPGSYCSDNIVVLCPTCHKKMHYARVAYSIVDNHTISVEINGEFYTFERNVISEPEIP
jgi:5-methylcytosine-specific restriction endonuclease McrA